MNLKEFIKNYREEINNKEFEKIYSLANEELRIADVGKLTDLFYEFGIDPLPYLNKIPNNYACKSSIKSIVIPSNIVSIGISAFEYCTSLTSVNISDSVKNIGGEAFSGCSKLTSVTIGNGVTSIGSYAFYGCTSLTNVTIGNGVTDIKDSAFSHCTSLKSITIPDSVTWIGTYAFDNCTSLKTINYKGSKEQWNNLLKDTRWDRGSSLETIHCTDGDIAVWG